jgi:hypothetical protein
VSRANNGGRRVILAMSGSLRARVAHLEAARGTDRLCASCREAQGLYVVTFDAPPEGEEQGDVQPPCEVCGWQASIIEIGGAEPL